MMMSKYKYAYAIFVSALVGALIGSFLDYNEMVSKKAVSYYKGGVVIEKTETEMQLDSCGTKKIVRATKYELSLYNLGDTIK